MKDWIKIYFPVWPRAIALLLLLVSFPATAVKISDYPVLGVMIDELVLEYGLDREQLRFWLTSARIDQEVITAMGRPAERLPWHRYRERFVTSASARAGKKFLARYSNALHRAEVDYGVPPEIIVAIIGIETRYGKITGSRRVLDSLISMALGYPRRSKYFLGELKEYLRLSGEGITNPLETRGSYAGAIGIPQFMPGSYRHYAVDFDNDGRRDLVRSVVDAIGSIAHYLYVHRWHSRQPVVERLSTDEFTLARPFVTGKLKADTPVENLVATGISPLAMNFTGSRVGVIRLQFSDHDEIRIGYPNFFVITRYNRSQSYAMAVFELAEKIAE